MYQYILYPIRADRRDRKIENKKRDRQTEKQRDRERDK